MVFRYGSPEEAGMSPERINKTEKLVEGWVEKGDFPSFVMLIARKGIIVSHKAFGKMGPEEHSESLRLDAIFPLSSISKPITATCVMILLEEGLLDLDHSVVDYIPEFTGEGKYKIKIHHLMTHTSGLRDEDAFAHAEKKRGTVEIPPADKTQHPEVHERLYLIYDMPVWKAPGEVMNYFNTGVMLLGEIVRRVSGKALADFAGERIFNPLGMNSTNYGVPEHLRSRVIRRSLDNPFGEWMMNPESLDNPNGAGGVYSTAMDMAVFCQMFMNGGKYGDSRIISPATVAQMTRNQIPGISASFEDKYFPEASWGYCWNVRYTKRDEFGSLCSPRMFSHGGAGGTLIWGDPEYDIVGAYFSVSTFNKKNEQRLYFDLYNNAVYAAIEEL